MPIPDVKNILLPLLKFASDGQEHTHHDAIAYLATYFNLSQGELLEMNNSGIHRKFDNRVGWARTYLKRGGLIESTGRSKFQITSLGINTLQMEPQKVNPVSLNSKRYKDQGQIEQAGQNKRVPDLQSLLLPLLMLAGDNEDHTTKEAILKLSQKYKTPAEITNIKRSSLANKVGWARTYLMRTGLITYPGRGKFQITELGIKVLNSNPTSISIRYTALGEYIVSGVNLENV